MPQSDPFRSAVRAASVRFRACVFAVALDKWFRAVPSPIRRVLAMLWASSLLAASRRTSLVIQESHWAPARAPAVKINVQRYQRRNQGAARIELNTIPCEALAWNQPSEVHQGLVDSINLNFPEPEIPPTT